MDDIAPPLAPLAPFDAHHGEGNRHLQGEGNRDPHGDADEWLSINAAARRLGVTATAIRNRIKRGTLETRPNGNFGKLVRVPLSMAKPVTLTPEQPVTGTVTLTPEASVPLTVTLTVLADHVTSLKAALAKAEAELELLRPERERADQLEFEAAAIPGLQDTIEALRAALEAEQGRSTEIRADRDRLLNRSWWRWLRISA